jgi:tRNA (cytidine/uridine-2'-O-)-methyltransferase
LFTTKAATPLPDFKFRADDRLLFGRESAGVPQAVHEAADARVIIPIAKGARSFNLATSVAIGLYDALRQTGGLPQ